MARLVGVALLLLLPFIVYCADPDPLSDFCVADNSNTNLFFNGIPCKNPASVTSADFGTSVLGTAGNVSNALGIGLGVASAASTVPGLNTQSLTVIRIDYAKGGLVPPHVHPRASEIVFVSKGSVYVGFVDTSGNLFSTTLSAGDIFVFPRGLVHFQYANVPSLSFSSLNSQSPGLSLVASALFGCTPSIHDIVLEKTFSLSRQEVEAFKKAFGH